MYNRYIPQDTGWTRVSEADFPPGPAAPRGPGSEPENREGFSSLLQGLLPPKADWEDLLILLLLLLLALEGEENELMITLGLLLVLGLD